MRATSLTLTAAIVVSSASGLTAVQVPTQRPSPDVVFPEPFTNISGIRTLSDGRILIADRTERHVSYLDFDAGVFEQAGREGQGPTEYQTPIGLFALPEDRTLLADLGNMRLMTISRAGEFETLMPMVSQVDGRMSLIRPEGTDRQGRIYYSTAGIVIAGPGGAPPTPPDSAPVLRYDPSTEQTDTVAMLGLPKPTESQGAPVRLQGGASFSVAGGGMPAPFAPRDDWGVADDGTVFVARATDYRVDRYPASGRMQPGATVSFEPVRVTQAVKEAWAERFSGGSVAISARGGGRGQTMRLAAPDVDEVEFPETLPPFTGSAVQVAPDGEIWVQLASAPDAPVRYDVFDASGRRVRRVEFAGRRSVAGFGPGVVYVTLTDEDDLQWLERYRR